MSLELILGNAGSGKSYRMYREIIEQSMANPAQNFLVIVPEQFTMQTQRDLVEMHPNHGIFNIDVLSFQRLAYRIFEETGGDSRIVLEETGKNLLICKAALENKEQLKVLGGNLKKIGYITEMKSLISELTQYAVGSEGLADMIEFARERPQLYYKLQDVRVLCEAFEKKLHEKYITADEILDVLCEKAEESEILRGAVIALDSFTGFTPIQQKLLYKLMPLSSKMMVTVTIDAKVNPYTQAKMHELFYLSKKTIQTLMQIAGETGVEITEPVVLGAKENARFAETPALHFLEQNLLRYRGKHYEKEQNAVSVHVSRNPSEEVHFAARTIRALAKTEGWRYRDIAVITGDMATYGSYVRRVFECYDIPCFMDETRRILLNPCTTFVRAALELVMQRYSYESVFRYLRSGLCDITSDEIDLVENYVHACGIRGYSMWKKPWERMTKKIREEKLVQCNETREKIMETLAPFTESVSGRKKTGKELTTALYELMSSLRIQEKLAQYEERFMTEGRQEEAKEYRQIYGSVMNLFDKLVELLGDDILTLKEYSEILEAGFEEVKVGIIPPTADRVVVGDIERTRLKNIRCLIFLGLNDGWVPKSGGAAGIISDIEREYLEGSGVELAPGVRENAYVQRFYLYMNITKPSDRLYLSYSKSGMDGSAMRPSFLIKDIVSLYQDIKVTDEDHYESIASRIVTPKSGIPYLVEGLRMLETGDMDDEWVELYNWYYTEDSYREKVEKLVNAAFLSYTGEGIGKETAELLYGKVLENSVSRLEQFAGCAFAHFMRYGLQISEREDYVFQPVDMGNIFHKVVELFSRAMMYSEYSWFDLPDEERERMTDEAVKAALDDSRLDILHSSARNEYMIERIHRIMRRTIWSVCEQVRAGRFQPDNFEVSFSVVENLEAVNIALGEEEKMRLRGRIDRIDTCDAGEQVYVKVIDYKSGNTDFDLVALYHGLQLQLVVYLNAAMELEKRVHPDKEIVPAGIFYYRMNDPELDREEGDTPEKINKRILKELKLNGLVNAEEDIVTSMAGNAEKVQDVLPIGYTKNGSYTAASSVAGTEAFHDLSRYVNRKMRELGSSILSGDVKIAPYARKSKTACDYCDYRSICGFDTKVDGMKYRRLKEYKPEEVWGKIRGKIRGGNEDGYKMDT